MIYEKKQTVRTIIFGLDLHENKTAWSIEESLNELAELCITAGLTVSGRLIQKRKNPHHSCYIGQGKLEELISLINKTSAEVLVADDELTPTQYKTLEKKLKIKILDRTSLILDIFSFRARTYEAKLQVELAQLEYLMPRLTRMWTHLSRLGGGIGTRGPGEKQLEVDKRQIRRRTSTIKRKLEKIKEHRRTRRMKRQAVPAVTAAIVGYTNSGKSTLLNKLTKSGVLVENKLFATLDPATKKLVLPGKDNVLLTDTVGFIQKLPHQLVSSFRATMEEIIDADILIRVVDASSPNFLSMIETADNILKELEAFSIPQIFVFNKTDKLISFSKLNDVIKNYKYTVCISALKEIRLEELLATIDKLLAFKRKQFVYRIPYKRMDIINLLHNFGVIVNKSYYNDVIKVEVMINSVIGEKIMGQLYSNQGYD
ncbi:MAG: GTPase HflX [bacterium]|nr:GTPase HflX [bacterium]